MLLVLINLFNYIDRQVLAAVVGPIKATFFGAGGAGAGETLTAVMNWFQHRLGFKPVDALIGLLGTAFMVFLVCLVTFLAAGTLGKLGAGYVGVTSDTLAELIKGLLTFASLAIVLGYLLRGFRTRLTGLAIAFLVVAVLVFPFPFVGKLDFIRASLFPDGISAETFRRMSAYLLALAAVEIVCWLAGKVEALPER